MKLKKTLSAILSSFLILETVSIFGLADGTSNIPTVYEDSFNYSDFAPEIYDDKNIWQTEFRDTSSTDVHGEFSAKTPVVNNGVLEFNEGYGVRLNWDNIDGIDFDASKTYTITFDLEINDFLDGTPLENSSAFNRELYFAVGGYYNQIEFRYNDTGNQNKGIRAGDSWYKETANFKLNSVYNATVVWKPSSGTITSTIKLGDTVVVTGSRSNNDYKTLNKYTKGFVWRCEDGIINLDNVTFSDGTTTYVQNFGTENHMIGNGLWGVENVRKTGLAPTLENGVVKLDKKDSIRFNWTKVPGVGNFSTENSYTFDFDFKITDKGDGSVWDKMSRSLYVAFGGWYTFIALDTDAKSAQIGGTSGISIDENKFVNTNLHASFLWEGKTIYTSVSDENGNVLLSGYRTGDAYADMENEKASMTNLVLRCEDGAVEIDNFKFTAEKANNNMYTTDVTPSSEQHKTLYEADIVYSGKDKVVIKLGDTELMSLILNSPKICGKEIRSSFGAGTYKIKIDINPTQEMLSVELTAPGGEVVRRALYTMLGGTEITAVTSASNSIENIRTTDVEITANEYTLTTEEPILTGSDANIYNVVTSFNEAQSTRNFAWTAKADFAGNSDMVLKYKKVSDSEWNTADAVRVSEEYEVTDEDYFKCDISDLTANTEYEYKIGIKDSEEDTDWSKIYTFKTAPEEIDSFSFVAVGDTQAHSWNGTTSDNKGAMFAKAAYDEAFEAVPTPAFILHTGDVVEWGGNKSYWNRYFLSLAEYGTRTPMFVTMGNHDTWTNEGENAYFDYHFNHPNNGGYSVLDPTKLAEINNESLKRLLPDVNETIYSFNYGDVHFISINSGGYESTDDCALISAQREWLRNDLEANKNAKWTIIFQHQPVYHRLGGSSDRGSNGLINDLIESYGVDLVIQGHSHLVTRTYPMKNGGTIADKSVTDEITEGTGTVYTTISSTALNHDGTSDSFNVEEMFSISVSTPQQATYTTVDVDENNISVTTRQLNGLILDEFTIVKPEVEVKTATVVFDANGGTWGTETEKTTEYEIGASVVKPETDPTREGYTFMGWTPEFSEVTALGATYKAVWEANHIKAYRDSGYDVVYVSTKVAIDGTGENFENPRKFANTEPNFVFDAIITENRKVVIALDGRMNGSDSVPTPCDGADVIITSSTGANGTNGGYITTYNTNNGMRNIMFGKGESKYTLDNIHIELKNNEQNTIYAAGSDITLTSTVTTNSVSKGLVIAHGRNAAEEFTGGTIDINTKAYIIRSGSQYGCNINGDITYNLGKNADVSIVGAGGHTNGTLNGSAFINLNGGKVGEINPGYKAVVSGNVIVNINSGSLTTLYTTPEDSTGKINGDYITYLNGGSIANVKAFKVPSEGCGIIGKTILVVNDNTADVPADISALPYLVSYIGNGAVTYDTASDKLVLAPGNDVKFVKVSNGENVKSYDITNGSEVELLSDNTIAINLTEGATSVEFLTDGTIKPIVTVSSEKTEVTQGEGTQLTANVTPDNYDVVWSIVTDSISEGTTVSESGYLTIAEDETASEITVKAAVTVNGIEVSAVSVITVKEKVIPVHEIKVILNRENGNTPKNFAKLRIYTDNTKETLISEYVLENEETATSEVTVSVTLAEGTYFAEVVKNGYLTYITEVTVTTEAINIPEIRLIPGDIKDSYTAECGDGIVDIDDFIRVLRGFSTDVSPELCTAVDINEDGLVNVSDIAYIKLNFGKTSK